MKILQYINRFLGISIFEKGLLFIAIFINLFFSALVRFFPMKFYSSIFKKETQNLDFGNAKSTAFILARKTINRVSIILPWRNSCLVKSLSYKYILAVLGVPSEIVIEVFKGPSEKIYAHAYVAYKKQPIYLIRKGYTGILIPLKDMP